VYVRVKNLTNDIVVLDSDTGILLDSEVRLLNLTTDEFEDIAPSLLSLESNFVIEYETLFLGDPRNDFPNREYILALIGAITAGSGGVFIYRPNDPSPGALVYDDWSDLMDTVVISGGGTILIDASFSGGSVSLEAGSYDLSSVVLAGVGALRPTVSIPAGVFLSTPTLYAENIDFVLNSSTDLLNVTSGTDGSLNLRNSSIAATGTGSFFSAKAGASSTKVLLENSSLLTSTGVIIESELGEIVEITAVQSTVENDVFSGAGDIDVISDAGSPIDQTQAPHLGTLTVVLKDHGSRVGFDDSSVLPLLSDHTPPDRDTVQSALDWFKEDRYKDVALTRDSKDIITEFQRASDPVSTITRDSKNRAIQVSDGVVQIDINRDSKGIVLSVTYTLL